MKKIESGEQIVNDARETIKTFCNSVENLAKTGSTINDPDSRRKSHLASFDLDSGEILSVEDYLTNTASTMPELQRKISTCFLTTIVDFSVQDDYAIALRDSYMATGCLSGRIRFREEILAYSNLQTGRTIWKPDIYNSVFPEPVKNTYQAKRTNFLSLEARTLWLNRLLKDVLYGKNGNPIDPVKKFVIP